MDLQHFKDDVFNGLVSGATVLLVLGTVGKGVVEGWFAKRLKKYEIDLKAVADQNQARHDYHFPKKADAAEMLLGVCRDLREKSDEYLSRFSAFSQRPNDSYVKKLSEMSKRIFDVHTEAAKAHKNNRHHFDNDLNKAIGRMIDVAFAITIVLAPGDVVEKAIDARYYKGKLKDQYDEVERGYRELVGIE